MQPDAALLCLTTEAIRSFLRDKLDAGVSPAAVSKYQNALSHLQKWLDADPFLTAHRLRQWRQALEGAGYSKTTVQGYVKRANEFLRVSGRPDLCIPKPMRNDLRGKTFGYLTVTEPTEGRHHGYVLWRCVCKCGNQVDIPSHMLIAGNTTSCGCLNIEILQHINRYEEGTELRQALEERIRNPKSASGYVGVQAKRDKWAAYITYKKTHYHLGTYARLEDAVKARARAKEAVMEDAARIYRETDHLYGRQPRRQPPPEKPPVIPPAPVVIPTRRSNNTSGCPGVSRSKGKWSANITFRNCRYRLGAFDAFEDAVAARKRAEELVKAGDLETLSTISTNWNGFQNDRKDEACV